MEATPIILVHLHRMYSYKLFVLILSICLGRFSSALNCSDKPFDCGSIAYIAYPFWGGDRTSECGRQGFELVCESNIPTLTISSLSYRVQELDFSTNTLTLARQDLHDTTCPNPLHNTTIDWQLFKHLPKSSDRNLTLYFDCTGNDIPNAFPCDNQTNNLFKIGDASSGPGSGIRCNANIYVPVNNKDAVSLQNPNPSSINILRSALTTGFSIQWFNDSKQLTAPFCNAQVYSSCLIRANNPRRCDYENCNPVSSEPAPSATEKHQGPAPVPSRTPSAKTIPTPAYAPQTQSRRAGNGPGLPPLPITAGYPLQLIHNNGKNAAKEIVIVVALSVAGTIIASISIHCFLKRRRLVIGPNPQCKQDVEKFLLQHGSLTPKRYKYSEIKKMTKSLSDKLGQGGYGSVYKGMLPDGCPVAVKILFEINSDGEEFMNEVGSISRTSHVNIVTLLGFCHEGNRRALVYEFMPNYSLDKFLNSNQSASGSMDCRLDLEKLYKIAVGIAKGLGYLHTGCNTRIVHFDIKPQNILLDEDFCPKISDFGLAKLCKKKQSIFSVPGTRGTIGYIAPEVFSRNFGGVSHKSDVYSYGMMLLEMAGARKFTEAEVIQSSDNYFPDKIYEQVISDVTKKLDDLMIEAQEETTRKMFLVGFWCIQTIPSNRPSMSKVVEMLEGSVESIEIPPKPFLFSPNLPTHQISSSLSAYVETENSARD